MKIYGIYQSDLEGGSYLKTPLYMQLHDAVKAAEELVAKENNDMYSESELNEIKNGTREIETDFMIVKQSDHVWANEVYYDIRIEAIELIK